MWIRGDGGGFFGWQNAEMHGIPTRRGRLVNSLSNRTALSFKEDFMRSLIDEALAGSMIQYFHGGCKYLWGNISKVSEPFGKYLRSKPSAVFVGSPLPG